MAEPYLTETRTSETPAYDARKTENGESPANHGSGNHTNGETAGMFPAALLPNGFTSALEINGPALKAIMALHRSLHESATSSAIAWAGFFHRRINENFAMAERLASCRYPEDIYRVNVSYLQKAADEYLAQVERTVMNGRGSTMVVFTTLARNSAVAPDDSRSGP